VKRLVNFQKLKKFLTLLETVYLDLVKVFYTNLSLDGEEMWTHVKGVDMVKTPVVWYAVVGLKYEGLKVIKGSIKEFKKIQSYRTCFRNPNAKVKSFGVEKLAMNPRILVFIILWILTPKGSNRMMVKWVYVMKDHIIKLKRLPNYKLPYVVLISRLLEFLEVELENELS